MSIQPIQPPAGELVNFPAAAAKTSAVDGAIVPPELADYVEDLRGMPDGLFAEEERFELHQADMMAVQKARADYAGEPAIVAYCRSVDQKRQLIVAERRRREDLAAAGGARNVSSVCLADGKQKHLGWEP